MKLFIISVLLIVVAGCGATKDSVMSKNPDKMPLGKPCSTDHALWQFAHVSDVHIGQVNAKPDEGYNRAIDALNRKDLKFSIFTGDISDNMWWGTWVGERELTKFKKMSERLKAPQYYIPGNHDVGYVYPSKWVSGKQGRLRMWEKIMGPLNQVMEYGGIKFVMLDNNMRNPKVDILTLEEWQFEWIEDILKEGKPTIIFGHVHTARHHKINGPMALRLIELMDKYPNAISFMHGHIHKGEFYLINKALHFGVPSTLGYDPTVYNHGPGFGSGHIAVNKVFKDRIETCLIETDGSSSHLMAITPLSKNMPSIKVHDDEEYYTLTIK